MKEAHTPQSHHKIVCPNCSFAADNNYCAQCGQETHLHQETFWGLVMHFVGHYFHYDSKFWITMKTLWFAPGKLTKDYWAGRRARHIPPVSLYIFISAVYFIASFSIHKTHPYPSAKPNTVRSAFSHLRQGIDEVDEAVNSDDTIHAGSTTITFNSDTVDPGKYFNGRLQKLGTAEGIKTFTEGYTHNFPKVFFFMIPIMGMLLKLSFVRRRNLLFVNHAVFSLHIHSLCFSVLLIEAVNPFYQIEGPLSFLCKTICLIYFVVAIRRTYEIGWGRAILNTFLVGFSYFLFLGIASFAIAAVALYNI